MRSVLRNIISLYHLRMSPRKSLITCKYLEPLILITICLLAFFTRLYSVVMFGSIVHEFDPHFNWRTTDYLFKHGFYQLNNWFDDTVWYPLGREVGATMFTGMMVTVQFILNCLHSIGLPVSVKDMCVFVTPLYAMITSLTTYYIGKQLKGESVGFFSAVFIAVIPAYMSRSVGGSFDNEGIAIAVMLLTFHAWMKAVQSGSVLWAAVCALYYFYMVSSWGGYIFVINLIPMHVLTLMLMGRFKSSHYVVYSTFYVLGTLLSMQIPFVGTQPITSSEHIGALGVFGLCQLTAFYTWLHSRMHNKHFYVLIRSLLLAGVALGLSVGSLLLITGKISPWTGRFYSLLDPSYAISHIPIIASVAEHQPNTWAVFYVDFHNLMFFFPVGCYFLIKNYDDLSIFVVLYATFTIYFSGVMIRLVLVLSPIFCIVAAVGLVEVLNIFIRMYNRGGKGDKSDYYMACFVLGCLSLMYLGPFMSYSLQRANRDFSNPTVCIPTGSHDGHNHLILDDFREAYVWLRQNTRPDAKIMSWWDYGYQLSALSNRTVLVDNNTWNNTHISRVGQAMASNESISYGIMNELDVDYVLLVFGGIIGYSSDDINKFLWMVRIGSNTERGTHIHEMDYFTPSHEYSVDEKASETMKNSMMYRMSYYRFAENVEVEGLDRVRQQYIPVTDREFDSIDEAFSSLYWIVRIFKVKKSNVRGHGMVIRD